MSIKSELLSILEINRNKPISGESIANQLNISRAYVWKVIKQLKEEGYDITATNNKGYQLNNSTDVQSREGILPFLNSENSNLPIQVFKSIGSTNMEAKRIALDGGIHGTTIIAEEQTAGRGRRGKSFFSPKSSGIYLSMILRLDLDLCDAVFITTATAVAVSNAIESVTGIKTSIKWVNDLYYNHKKVCGILTEAVTDFESGSVDSIVVGIGINFLTDSSDFPDELQSIAGSLYQIKPSDITRNQLCAEIINQMLLICRDLKTRTYLTQYKERSMVLHKEIWVIKENENHKAIALDIDSNGGLLVQYESGDTELLNSGEISIRPLDIL